MTCNEQQFLKDVIEHQMTVLHEDLLYRHIRFKQPDSMHQHFDLITWPGYLCYTGDMGTFVFRRLDDMFTFFRRPLDAKYGIDFRYWAEKCEAEEKGEGISQYSPEKFKTAIVDWLDQNDASVELREAVVKEVLNHADDDERDAIQAAIDFEFKGRQVFQDFWEVNVHEYTPRFVWCCHALVWGIQKYDDYCRNHSIEEVHA